MTSFRLLFVFQESFTKVSDQLIYFSGLLLGHTVKTNFKTFQTVEPEVFFISYKRVLD